MNAKPVPRDADLVGLTPRQESLIEQYQRLREERDAAYARTLADMNASLVALGESGLSHARIGRLVGVSNGLVSSVIRTHKASQRK